jgi:hypothetical protein
MGPIAIARVRILPNGFSSQRSVLMPHSTVSLGPPKRPPLAGAAAEIHYRAPTRPSKGSTSFCFAKPGKQIDMAAYVLSDSAVIEALRDASARGEKVRVWRDASGAACCSKRRDSLGLSVRS